ncbi:hypothetical protein CBFG_01416 [Clostridiales bacterium 1_7_47FAA]|nr:hypothetical protein CBFG_01416 [Clostridiales bacterium 1_7_47FAA]
MFEVKPSSTLLFPTSVSIYYYTKKTIPAQESYNLSSQNPFDSFQSHQRTFINPPPPPSSQQIHPHRESPILPFMAGVHSPGSRAGLVLCGAGGFLRAAVDWTHSGGGSSFLGPGR